MIGPPSVAFGDSAAFKVEEDKGWVRLEWNTHTFEFATHMPPIVIGNGIAFVNKWRKDVEVLATV